MLGEMTQDKAYVKRALETCINVGLALLLVAVCFLILRPFVLLIAWGIIIAVAAYPAFQKLRHLLREHGTFAAVVFTLILLAILILPVVLLGQSLVEGVQTATARLKDGTAFIPPPPPGVESWPIIGRPLQGIWSMASRDISAVIDQICSRNQVRSPRATVRLCRSRSHRAATPTLHPHFRITPGKRRSRGRGDTLTVQSPFRR